MFTETEQAAQQDTGETTQAGPPPVDDFDMDGDDIFDGIMEEVSTPPEVKEDDNAAKDDKGEQAKKPDVPAGDDAGTGDDGKPQDTVDPDTLQARLAELENTNRGLLGGLTAQRKANQEMKARMEQIASFLEQMQASKALTQGQKNEIQDQAERELEDIPLTFDNDDNPIIPVDKVASAIEQRLLDKLEQKITPLQEELIDTKTQTAQQAKVQNMQNVVQSVVSEKDEFKDAMAQLQSEWAWLNDKFSQYVAMTGKQPSGLDEIREMIYSSGLDGNFEEAFPESDLDTVFDAFTNPSPVIVERRLKKALNMHVKQDAKPDESIEDKKAAFDKAKTLAGNIPFGQVPGKTKTPNPLEDVANMDPEDFMDLPDEAVDRVMRLLKKGG